MHAILGENTMPRQVTHHNHYVPIWYQKGFIEDSDALLQYLDLDPSPIELPDGRVIPRRAINQNVPRNCFVEEDLYTTYFGDIANDIIERELFGTIDNFGARAVRAVVSGDFEKMHEHFQHFFEYLSAQKIRTPKGLDWIKSKYLNLNQLELMEEMRALSHIFCTMWIECVREIVSATESDVKFIMTDHPVTIYNAAYPPSSSACEYPNDPGIGQKGSQTVFPLDANHCLILSNFEYAKNPTGGDLTKQRTNARHGGRSITRTDAFIRMRMLTNDEVSSINLILKARAKKYIAASDESWLETQIICPDQWGTIGRVLLPPSDEVWAFGGETLIGFRDGSVLHQDTFGRTSEAHKYLKKVQPSPFDQKGPCGCGSGRKFKQCCAKVPEEDRPSWDVYGIRERNLMFITAICDILGVSKGKTWIDVRRELNDDQVRQIHQAFSSLWPGDTLLPDLLPRPNKEVFRAIQLGLVDPRTIDANITGWLPYFDEVIVCNPFTNADLLHSDFSPIKSPGKFKAQTLKDVTLLLKLKHFIDAGFIHLVPDPGDFGDIRHVVWDMARRRIGDDVELNDHDLQKIHALKSDDLKRAVYALPEDVLRAYIQQTSPEVAEDDEFLQSMVAYAREQQEQDPLALLQPFTSEGRGEQIEVLRGFNLEVGLYLAQLSGSVIYTEDRVHWKHLHEHATASRGSTQWLPVIETIEKWPFRVETHPLASFNIRKSGKHARIRTALQQVYGLVCQQSNKAISGKFTKRLVSKLKEDKKYLAKIWRRDDKCHTADPLQGNLALSIPAAGFDRNAVRRLLLMYGMAEQVNVMPMAMLMRLTSPKQMTEDGV